MAIVPEGFVPEGSAARSPRVRLAMLMTTAAIVTADQVSKTLVLALDSAGRDTAAGTGFVNVRLLRNTGANGGIASGYPVLVTLIAAAIACAAVVFALRVRGRGMAICLAVLVGGALGNLADRLFRSPGLGRGGVVDWIHLSALKGSFNVADLAIQCGLAGLVITFLAGEHSRKARQPREHATGA